MALERFSARAVIGVIVAATVLCPLLSCQRRELVAQVPAPEPKKKVVSPEVTMSPPPEKRPARLPRLIVKTKRDSSPVEVEGVLKRTLNEVVKVEPLFPAAK